MIVRLKEAPRTQRRGLPRRFQFYDSPIKSRTFSASARIASSLFQFYDSPIKS